ncbi:division/cell wall cluster transcriptional repressor MraZ [Cardiobacteriaceae bacterium TAE3-ERU3]|nr:division/cell wall cluster transcriptional repressor MraZ [Cardiobacteriaceae bacterium TAE3-ERU3]
MFLGTFPISLDSKGRLSIPAKLRDFFAEESDNTLVITADVEKNLLVYTLDQWEKVVPQLVALPSFNARARSIKRLYMGYANDCNIDASGRVLIPPALREYAGLDKKVMLVGMGNKFELWDKARWDEVNAQDAALLLNDGFEGFDDVLGSLSL